MKCTVRSRNTILATLNLDAEQIPSVDDYIALEGKSDGNGRARPVLRRLFVYEPYEYNTNTKPECELILIVPADDGRPMPV